MTALQAPLPVASAPTAAPACDANAPLDCSSPEAFVRSIWPHAQKTAAELGVPAKALVAQAALETGWGRRLVHKAGEISHNLFGIKAGSRWTGARMSANTHEYSNGVRHSERADFRAYGSAADSFADYARLLGNDRYAGARGTGDDTHRFASALQHAGYATDPSYAAKITAIANGATINRALAALPAAPAMNTVAAISTHTVPRG
jgi:flagellar protein FlgJ